MKKWAEFCLTSFGTLNYDCVIKGREMLNFMPLVNNSVTSGFSSLLLIKSTIISSKIINILRFLPTLYSSIFYKHLVCHLNIQ